jgi:signal transduction histidine kinase
MYEYAKLGEKAAKMGPLSLTQIVEETVHDLRFDEKLDVQIGLGDLPEVWGNPELLRRMFMNLFANAVKYNDKPATIINVSTRTIREEVLGTFAELSVEDNGPGIPEQDQGTIFSMFSRGVAERGPKEGSGVGLAVVQRIVELHFGSIRVESPPGQGARFVFTLPTEAMAFVR